jgi:type II secretory pathway component PulC
VRQFISIITIAILLTATACAPKEEKTEVSCPRPDDSAQILKNAQMFSPSADRGDIGIYLSTVAPDSFWACAGIQEGSYIIEFNSRPISEGPVMLELLELVTQDLPLEFTVLNPSGDRRSIVIH